MMSVQFALLQCFAVSEMQPSADQAICAAAAVILLHKCCCCYSAADLLLLFFLLRNQPSLGNSFSAILSN